MIFTLLKAFILQCGICILIPSSNPNFFLLDSFPVIHHPFQRLPVNKLTALSYSLKKEFKGGIQCSIPLVELNLSLENSFKPETKSLLLTPDKLLTLSMELKKIKKTMQRISGEL